MYVYLTFLGEQERIHVDSMTLNIFFLYESRFERVDQRGKEFTLSYHKEGR